MTPVEKTDKLKALVAKMKAGLTLAEQAWITWSLSDGLALVSTFTGYARRLRKCIHYRELPFSEPFQIMPDCRVVFEDGSVVEFVGGKLVIKTAAECEYTEAHLAGWRTRRWKDSSAFLQPE